MLIGSNRLSTAYMISAEASDRVTLGLHKFLLLVEHPLFLAYDFLFLRDALGALIHQNLSLHRLRPQQPYTTSLPCASSPLPLRPYYLLLLRLLLPALLLHINGSLA